jgi:hypothetical protein
MYFLPEAQSTHFLDGEAEEREILSHYLSNVVIWAPGNPPNIEQQVRKTLANVAPNLVVNGIQPYSEIIHSDFAQQNMIASLTWLFGAIGLVLAAVGLYGVTAYGAGNSGGNRRRASRCQPPFWGKSVGSADVVTSHAIAWHSRTHSSSHSCAPCDPRGTHDRATLRIALLGDAKVLSHETCSYLVKQNLFIAKSFCR